MTVYADILFLINLITDCLCLYVTGRIMGFSFKALRLSAASVIGALYGTLSAFVIFTEPVCCIAVSVLMIVTAFTVKGIVSLIKSVVLLYCVGMLFGGIMTFIRQTVYENRNLGMFGNGVGLPAFIAIFCAVLVFMLVCSGLFSLYIHKVSQSCVIKYKDKSVKVNLLVDTGNMLKDPYTGLPVAVVKKDVLDILFGKNGIHTRGTDIDAESAVLYGIRFVTANTVSGCTVLTVYGALKLYSAKGNKNTLGAVVAADLNENNDYSGSDGVMPYICS